MSLRPLVFHCTTLFALCHFASAQATIEGRVTLPASKSAPVMTKRYEVVTRGGVLATNPPLAIVYLEGANSKGRAHPNSQVVQKEMNFIPTLLAIEVGTKVEFPNEDDTYHNIFSYSPAKRFDLGRYRPDERPIPSVIFDKEGLITLRCDIHEHMRGLILVLNTPYFTTTGPDGHFKLKGLPPGNYTLKAWIDSRTTREHPVQLQSGSKLQIDFP
ncbi:MAG TPA: carboxypeptidase regulatory-like domain-containing protein [Chthoniobacterales bacterium]|nr:carboxypeptidase regulatory-like domain-containing protein [Chthoniobacterales bacterium]